jgi:hypothetical protein
MGKRRNKNTYPPLKLLRRSTPERIHPGSEETTEEDAKKREE